MSPGLTSSCPPTRPWPSQPASQPSPPSPSQPSPRPVQRRARPVPRFRSGPPSDEPRRPPWQPGRRSFLTASAVAVAAGGVAALAGRALTERSNVSAALSHIRFPQAAHPVPPLPPGTDLDIQGLSSVRHAELGLLPGGHRADPPPGGAADLAAAHPRDGGARDHHQLSRPAEAPADRGLDHAVLRLQPGGRPLHRERQVARRQPGQPAAGRAAAGPAPTSCCAPPPTGSPRAPRWPRSWMAGTRCWPWP